MKTFNIVAWVVVIVSFAALGLGMLLPDAGGVRRSAANGFYTRPGTYTTKNNFKLELVDARGLLEFGLKDSAGTELCSNGELHPSTYHRWFFYADSRNRLWMYSGDIGTFVWAPDASGRYVRASVQQVANGQRVVPRVFFDALPSTARRGLIAE